MTDKGSYPNAYAFGNCIDLRKTTTGSPGAGIPRSIYEVITTTITKEEINAGLTRDRFVTVLSDPVTGIELLINSSDYHRLSRAGMSDEDIFRARGITA